MYQMDFKIVGLPYHAWGGEELGDKVRSAVGKRVTLSHDCDNEKNSEATMAVIDTELVGYVCNEVCHVVSTYCDRSATKTLSAVVVDYDERGGHYALWARTDVGEMMDVEKVHEHEGAKRWSEEYGWLATMKKTDEEKRMKALVGEMKRVLMEGRGLDGEQRVVFDAYLQECRWYVSWEATQEREELQRLTAASEHEDMREWSRQLGNVMTMMGNEVHLAKVYDRMFEERSRDGAFLRLCRMHEELKLGALSQALSKFPGWMYQYFGKMEKWEYVSTLYYMRVPEVALNRFVTGVLMERQLREWKEKEWTARKSCEELEGNEERGTTDVRERMKRVIEQMREEQCLRHQYDYVWLMVVMNRTEGLPHFDGLQSFTDFLHDDLGLEDAPARSTMHAKMYVCGGGNRPEEWSFSDTRDAKECQRRINVAKRFLRLWREWESEK